MSQGSRPDPWPPTLPLLFLPPDSWPLGSRTSSKCSPYPHHRPWTHLPEAVTYHGLEIRKGARGAVEELRGKPALLPAAVPDCITLETEACSDCGSHLVRPQTYACTWPTLALSMEEDPSGGYASHVHSHRTGPIQYMLSSSMLEPPLSCPAVKAGPLGSQQCTQPYGYGQACEPMS